MGHIPLYDTGETARRAAGETRLNFGETAPWSTGGDKGEASHPGGIVAARASPLERLRRGSGTHRSPERRNRDKFEVIER